MLLSILCLLVSYIPAVLLYLYLRNLRRDDAVYRVNCRSLLIRGVLCSVGVAVLALTTSLLWGFFGPGDSMPLLKAAFMKFVVAALLEELIKYFTATRVIDKNRERVTRIDCMAFGAIVGIGFQMIETVVYLLESSPGQILVRGFTMGHPSYGMLMGFFLGKAVETGKNTWKIPALLVPVLIHGLYDFSLTEEFQALNDNLVFIPVLTVLLEVGILIRLLLYIRKNRSAAENT